MSYMGFKQCVIATWTVGLNNVATKTRSSATAERQRVSYTCLSRFTHAYTSPHRICCCTTIQGGPKKI